MTNDLPSAREGGSAEDGELVFLSLSRAIIDGRIAAGDRISAQEIARRDDDPQSLLEALTRLCRIGFAEWDTPAEVRVLSLDVDAARETLLVLAAHAAYATRLAVELMSADEILHAVSLIDTLLIVADIPQPLRVIAVQLLQHFERCSGSAPVVTLGQDFPLLYARMTEMTETVRPLLLIEIRTAYARLREALLRRDATDASAIVRELYSSYAGGFDQG